MKNTLGGVAFDLDGTLYPNRQLYVRIIPFLLREYPLMIAMGKARSVLRAAEQYPEGEFYDTQAYFMAHFLKADPEEIKVKAEALIYRGWEPLFKEIKLFPDVKQVLGEFRSQGLKIGMLSDFPPETKLDNLGLAGYWDAIVCSEVSGRLKPDPKPFLDLAEKMALPPEQILYVGNSLAYDINGARQVGMKTALISPFRRLSLGRPSTGRRAHADLVFSRYRQLAKYVLNWNK
jgi:putative hydrolase of the HAD superfamily